MMGDGNGYQPTPTGAIRHWHAVCSQLPGYTDRTFIDIGAGKGKVCREWLKLNHEAGIEQAVVAIESSTDLVERLNGAALAAGFDVILGDATEVPYTMFDSPLLLWLFNPFNDIDPLISALNGCDIQLVCNNPAHATRMLEYGWHLLDLTYGGSSSNSWFLISSREPA